MRGRSWLAGGNDRELSKSYGGPSASEVAKAKEHAKALKDDSPSVRPMSAAKSRRAVAAWEDADRRRFSR